MAELTQAQYEWVKDYCKRIGLSHCAMCDSKSVTAHKLIVKMLSPRAEDGIVYGRNAFMIVCDNCAHIMLFDLDLLEVLTRI